MDPALDLAFERNERLRLANGSPRARAVYAFRANGHPVSTRPRAVGPAPRVRRTETNEVQDASQMPGACFLLFVFLGCAGMGWLIAWVLNALTLVNGVVRWP